VASRLAALPAGTRILLGYDVPVVPVAASVAEAAETEEEIAETDLPLEGAAVNPAGARPLSTGNGHANGHGHSNGNGHPNGNGKAAAVVATLEALRKKGFGRLLVDGRATAFDDVDVAALAGRPELHVIVDRLIVEPGI
jgi:GNAT superfamily N-acetyltransferase